MNERGAVTATIDVHWQTRDALFDYLATKFENENQDFQGSDDEFDEARIKYIEDHFKWGKACAFCNVFCIWNAGDQPHLVNGRLQLTAPIVTYTGILPN